MALRARQAIRWPEWSVAGLVTVLCSGCAVHYSDARSGREHLWGLGQLRLQTKAQSPANGWVAVASGSRVPGLCVSVGRDRFGVTVGYSERQRLAIVPADRVAAFRAPAGWFASMGSRGERPGWMVGHASMRGAGSPEHHCAVITGRALAGFGFGAGGEGAGLKVAFQSQQTAFVRDPDVHGEVDQDAPRWPGFDLFAARVRVSRMGEGPAGTQATNLKGTGP